MIIVKKSVQIGLIISAFSFILSCQKEISYELSPGTSGSGTSSAVFLIAGDCSSITIKGDYIAGAVVSLQEKIVVPINVTKTGDWSFSTGVINGLTFSGAGNISTVGLTEIVLTSNGKPDKEGQYSYLFKLSDVNCSFKITVSGATGGGGTAPGEYYYKATIGGVNYYQTATWTNGYIAGSGMGGLDDVSFGADISPEEIPFPANSTMFGVTKGIMHNYINSSDSAFKAFFKPGTYPYAPISPLTSVDGIYISWMDKTGANWITDGGTGNQTGSTFKILSVSEERDVRGILYLRVKMQFNCKLYKEGTGEMRPLTNGEFVGLFGKI
jgi:hypothetical protein